MERPTRVGDLVVGDTFALRVDGDDYRFLGSRTVSGKLVDVFVTNGFSNLPATLTLPVDGLVERYSRQTSREFAEAAGTLKTA